VALERTDYKKEQATEKEITSLLGSYELEDGRQIQLARCDDNICYSFVGQPGQSAIFKAQNNYWFTPNLNRAFQIIKTSESEVEQLMLKDFMGEQIVNRKHKKS